MNGLDNCFTASCILIEYQQRSMSSLIYKSTQSNSNSPYQETAGALLSQEINKSGLLRDIHPTITRSEVSRGVLFSLSETTVLSTF